MPQQRAGQGGSGLVPAAPPGEQRAVTPAQPARPVMVGTQASAWDGRGPSIRLRFGRTGHWGAHRGSTAHFSSELFGFYLCSGPRESPSPWLIHSSSSLYLLTCVRRYSHNEKH